MFIYVLLSFIAGAFIITFAMHLPRRHLDPTAVEQLRNELRNRGEKLEDVSLQRPDGATLRGWLLRPAAANGRVVILLHGVTDNRLGSIGMAKIYLRHGYTVLLPDSRAHGESGGELATYGVLERNDIAGWVSWLIQSQHVSCVYGHGGSMGAALILQALAVEPRFCAVIAESPFASFREISYDRISRRFHCGPWLGRTVFHFVVDGAIVWSRLRYNLPISDANPQNAVASSSVPIFIIDGADDDGIPPRHTDLIVAHHPANVTTWRVPHAGHGGMWAAAGDDFPRRVLSFMAAH